LKKFVFFVGIEPFRHFKASSLESISRLHGDTQLAAYIEERILDASLNKLVDYGPLMQLELSCKFRGRRPIGKLVAPRPIIEQKSDIWVYENGKLCLAIDMPLNLSFIASALISDSFFGRLGEVSPLRMNRQMFMSLKEHVESKNGKLVSVHLLNVIEPSHLDVLQASERTGVESYPGIRESLATSRIKRLGFHLNLEDQFFSFWIADFGNGTLYSPPVPEPHHLGRFIKFFEESLDYALPHA